MSYRLDVTVGRDWLRGAQVKDAVIVQVGCGGTGSSGGCADTLTAATSR